MLPRRRPLPVLLLTACGPGTGLLVLNEALMNGLPEAAGPLQDALMEGDQELFEELAAAGKISGIGAVEARRRLQDCLRELDERGLIDDAQFDADELPSPCGPVL
jgi:hypothetical protein